MKSLLILLLATSTSLAQAPSVVPSSPAAPEATRVVPSEGSALAVLISKETGSQWRALAVDFVNQRIVSVMPTVYDDGKSSLCIVEGPFGTQVAVTRFRENVQYETSVVTLGARAPPVVRPDQPVNPQVPVPGLPLTGMRVLILEERNPTSALPLTLQHALQSPEVIKYLDNKAADQASGLRRWRRLDPSVTFQNLSKEWQDLRAAVPSTTIDQPQIVISGASSAGGAERVAYVGPYPDSEEKVMELLRKHGG